MERRKAAAKGAAAKGKAKPRAAAAVAKAPGPARATSSPSVPRKSSVAPAATGQVGEKEEILSVFKRFDVNGDNSIELDELATVLKALDPGSWADDKISRLFDDMDTDSSGRISTVEFVDWVTDFKPAQEKRVSVAGSEFMGAFELAKTYHAPHAINVATSSSAPVFARDLRGDLRRIKGADIAAEVNEIASRDLEIVRKMSAAPEPMRRTVEAVCLLLGASKGGSSIGLSPPDWATVQRHLGDNSFLQRIRNVTARRTELKRSPILGAYVAEVYFGARGMDGEEPLTYERILATSRTQFGLTGGRAGPIVALYRWCLSVLEPELRELLELEEAGAREEAKEAAKAEDAEKEGKAGGMDAKDGVKDAEGGGKDAVESAKDAEAGADEEAKEGGKDLEEGVKDAKENVNDDKKCVKEGGMDGKEGVRDDKEGVEEEPAAKPGGCTG